MKAVLRLLGLLCLVFAVYAGVIVDDEAAVEDTVTGGDDEAATDEVQDPDVLQCITGTTVDGTGNTTSEYCSPGDDTCQRKIEVRNGTKIVYRECKPLSVCEENAKNNAKECYSALAKKKGLRVCFTCCGTENCNKGEAIPKRQKPSKKER